MKDTTPSRNVMHEQINIKHHRDLEGHLRVPDVQRARIGITGACVEYSRELQDPCSDRIFSRPPVPRERPAQNDTSLDQSGVRSVRESTKASQYYMWPTGMSTKHDGVTQMGRTNVPSRELARQRMTERYEATKDKGISANSYGSYGMF